MVASSGSAVDLVRVHLEAEDRQDLDAAMAVFTGACWYRIPSRGLRLVGRDAVRAHHAGMFRAFPDLRNDGVELFDAGRRVFARILLRRTHRGDWAGFPPTGRPMATEALAEFVVAPDGLIEAEIVHMNPLEALRQIGVVDTDDVLSLVPRPQAGAR